MIVKYTLTEDEIKEAVMSHIVDAYVSEEIDRDKAIVRISRDPNTGEFVAEVEEVL